MVRGACREQADVFLLTGRPGMRERRFRRESNGGPNGNRTRYPKKGRWKNQLENRGLYSERASWYVDRNHEAYPL
jgi:hypothetical protein